MHMKVFCGRSYEVAHEIATESVYLVYADPPYKSDVDYNIILPKSNAQIKAFEDCWSLSEESDHLWRKFKIEMASDVTINTERNKLAVELVDFFYGKWPADIVAYLRQMTPLIIQAHRILNKRGTFALQCDPTINGYLRVVADQVFGAGNFIDSIVWLRTSAHNNAKNSCGHIHDTILVYQKGPDHYWNTKVYQDHSEKYILGHYKYKEKDGVVYRYSDPTGSSTSNRQAYRGIEPPAGRRYMVTRPMRDDYCIATNNELPSDWVQAYDELIRLGIIAITEKNGSKALHYRRSLTPGKPLQDVWDDINGVGKNSDEYRNYPTQKPIALLTRLIEATTEKGQLVVDLFMGSGTTGIACIQTERDFIGIELETIVYEHTKKYLEECQGHPIEVTIQKPQSLEDFKKFMVQDRYKFQVYMVEHLLNAVCGPKGADGGLDGTGHYIGLDSEIHPYHLHVTTGDVSPTVIRTASAAMELKKKQGVEFAVIIGVEGRIPRTAKGNSGKFGKIEYQQCFDSYDRIQVVVAEDLFVKGESAIRLPGKLLRMGLDVNPTREFRRIRKMREEEQARLKEEENSQSIKDFMLEQGIDMF
jgi:DNA modification methylase